MVTRKLCLHALLVQLIRLRSMMLTRLTGIYRHVLMLQIANAFFKLPGDYLKPGEEEVQGLKDRLNHILAPLDERGNPTEGEWEIGDCIAQWWRPNFETFMVSPPTIFCSLYCQLLEEKGKPNSFRCGLFQVPLCPSAHFET